jgi:hypothetical protein
MLASNHRKWTFQVKEGHTTHNHPAAEDHTDLQLKWKTEHKAFVLSFLNRPAVSSREIARQLRDEFPGIIFNRRQLRNLRGSQRKATLEGYTDFQAAKRYLDDESIHHTVLWSPNDPTKPEGLFWCPEWCQQQWQRNPWVQEYDNTYKTNNKMLALFQVVGINHSNKTFGCGFGLINNERQEGFDWLMDRVNYFRQMAGAKEPTVTISDYDTAMKAAIARVFPDAISMICVFHVNKNVVLHIKRKWDKQAAALVNAAQVAQNNHQDADDKDDVEEEDRGVVNRMNRVSRGQVDIGPPPETVEYSRHGFYTLWEHILFATSLEDFNTAYEKIKAFFPQQTALLDYLETTYMEPQIVTQWATCYTNRHLNFGHRTTSPVESVNRNHKSFLINGNSTIRQVIIQSINMIKSMEETINESRKEQKRRIKQDYLHRQWLGDARYNIAHLALTRVNQQYQVMLGAVDSRTHAGVPLTPCTNQFSTQMGIPCSHRLLVRYLDQDNGGLKLQKADFHPY